jgi:MFS family permease
VKTVIRTTTFWWLTTAFFFNMLMITAVGVHLVPMLRDKGFDAGFAAGAAGLIGLMSLPGRLIFTMLGERLPRRWVIAAIFLAMTVGLAVLIDAQSQARVILFVVLYGAGFGAIAPGRAALVADLYGSESYGRINSVIALITTLSRVIAPVLTGILYDSLRSYTPVLWGLVVISALSVMTSLLIGSEASEPGIMVAE